MSSINPAAHPEPYVSIVVVARNDNYGGDFLRRVRLFSRMLQHQATKHPDLFEVIVVNWNPLSDRASIAEAVDWSMSATVRVVTVDTETHHSISRHPKMPVLEYYGKNVGIKRARGRFVLVTNPDIVLSDELFDLLAQRNLRDDAFYRTDRYDFHDFQGEDLSPPSLMREIQANVFQVFGRNFKEATDYPNAERRLTTQPIEGEVMSDNGRQLLNDWRNDPDADRPMLSVHDWASGDFVLASRRLLELANGFWERTDTFSHLDSLLVFRFRGLGVPQVILRAPYCIFHLDHSRAEQSEKPDVERTMISRQGAAVIRNQCPDYAQQESWGLDLHDLEEIFIPRLAAAF